MVAMVTMVQLMVCSDGKTLNDLLMNKIDIKSECWSLCSMDYEKCIEFYQCPIGTNGLYVSEQCIQCPLRSSSCLEKCLGER